jgi:hypothetical protein
MSVRVVTCGSGAGCRADAPEVQEDFRRRATAVIGASASNPTIDHVQQVCSQLAVPTKGACEQPDCSPPFALLARSAAPCQRPVLWIY